MDDEEENFQQENLYLALISNLGCKVELKVKFAKQFEEEVKEPEIDLNLPKIDFDMYLRKFQCTFMARDNVRLNWEQAQNWAQVKKTQELQKIIGNQRKQKLVFNNKKIIDLDHRVDKIEKLNKWDCFKWRRNEVICTFIL